MSTIVWHCQEIGRPSAICNPSLLIKTHRPSFIFLFEVKCHDVNVVCRLVRKLCFDDFEFVPSVGKSGGLLLAWKTNFNIKIVVASLYFVNYHVFDGVVPLPWQFTLVYGPPTYSMRRAFWDSLDEIGSSFNGPWMMIGDFNVVLHSADKIGGQPVASSNNGGLHIVINNNGLIDMGYEGYAFTWNNKRSGLANIQERLDRGFANSDWRVQFLNATITHLPIIQSDHKPLLVALNPPTDNLLKPFKFETMWISHPDTGYIILEAWHCKSNIVVVSRLLRLP